MTFHRDCNKVTRRCHMWSKNCLTLRSIGVHPRWGSLVFCVLPCIILLTFCLFLLWPLHNLSLFAWRLLITLLASSNISYTYSYPSPWRTPLYMCVWLITHVSLLSIDKSVHSANTQSCSVHPRVVERAALSMGDCRVIIRRVSQSLHALCVVIPHIFF